MDPTQGILDQVRQRGRLWLAGNGQYFEGIDYVASAGFLHFFGDSGLNEETARDVIGDAKVLELVRAYVRRQAAPLHELATDADVLAYMVANPRL